MCRKKKDEFAFLKYCAKVMLSVLKNSEINSDYEARLAANFPNPTTITYEQRKAAAESCIKNFRGTDAERSKILEAVKEYL